MTGLLRVRVVLTALALVAACDDRAEVESMPPIPVADMGPHAAEHMRRERERLLPLAQDPGRGPAQRAEAYAELGRVLQAYGLLEPATVAYRNALALGASLEPTGYLLAVASTDLGRSDDAEEQLRRVLAANPEHAGARLRLAAIALEGGRVEEARDLYARVAAAASGDDAAHAGLGKAALAAGDYTQAIESFDRALELQPRASSLHRLLAQAHARMGATELAERHLVQAGDVEVAIADPDLALVQSLAVGAGSAVRRGDGAMLAGDFERAVVAYREAAELAPEDAGIHHSLAAALFRSGNLAEALTSYRRSAALDPGNAAVRFSTGVTLMRLGRSAEAIAELRRALVLDDRAEYRAGLAEALWLNGEPAAAEQQLEKVLAENPQVVEAQALLARLLIARERSAEDSRRAVALATELVRGLPSVEHVELLAAAYAAAGRFDLAVDWQRQLLERVGADADPTWRRRAEQNLARYAQNQPPATPE